jgi:hypothetical protein
LYRFRSSSTSVVGDTEVLEVVLV